MSHETVTHEHLRKAAVRWLTNSRKCSVVISEMVSAAWECPDAIGWKSGYSILVECKASRSDLFANAKKPTLEGDRGVGCARYFMIPKGLASVDDMARFDGYGLLLMDGDRVTVALNANLRETNRHNEILMLTSALRRVKTREFLTVVPFHANESGEQ